MRDQGESPPAPWCQPKRTKFPKKYADPVRQRNLQNPANKRNTLCGAVLKAVMGKDEVTMFKMTGLVSKHMA